MPPKKTKTLGSGASPMLIVYPAVIFSLVLFVNAIILYYLLGLEKEHCNCHRDKQHNFLKTLTVVNMVWPVLSFILVLVLNLFLKPELVKLVQGLVGSAYTIILFMGAVVLWRYVDKLNRENCACAEKDMQNINGFLMLWRWVQLIVYSLAAVGVVIAAITMLRSKM